MIYLAIKKANGNESDEAKALRDGMLLSVIDNFNPDDIKIADGGKPYLPDNHVGFSVAHSKGVILSAINCYEKVSAQEGCINLCFEGGSGSSIGADIEVMGQRDLNHLEKISCKWFSEDEQKSIQNAKDKEFAILELWTKKEAYLKLLGIGVKGLAFAKTEALQGDYLFLSKKITLDCTEAVVSICVKR